MKIPSDTKVEGAPEMVEQNNQNVEGVQGSGHMDEGHIMMPLRALVPLAMNGNPYYTTAVDMNGHTVVSQPQSVTAHIPSPGSETPLEGKALIDQLRTQLEYYFSRENLNHDTYLVSQMDADQYVDISIIANFNQVRKLTSDIQLVVQALRDSPQVQVDEAGLKVRPLHKRCIVILREIPHGTTQEEVEGIFHHEECPPFVRIERAVANGVSDFWYIHFETEEHAQKAFRYVNDTLQNFKGAKIMARIKAKPSIQSQQPRPERSSVTTEGQAPPSISQANGAAAPSTIRYPIPLTHYPVAPPPPQSFQLPIQANWPYTTAYHPYFMQQHHLVPPNWSIYPDSTVTFDVNNFHLQHHMGQQRPAYHGGNATTHPRREKQHSRANSTGSDRLSVSERQPEVPAAVVNVPAPTQVPVTASQQPPAPNHTTSSQYTRHTQYNHNNTNNMQRGGRTGGTNTTTGHREERPPRHQRNDASDYNRSEREVNRVERDYGRYERGEYQRDREYSNRDRDGERYTNGFNNYHRSNSYPHHQSNHHQNTQQTHHYNKNHQYVPPPRLANQAINQQQSTSAHHRRSNQHGQSNRGPQSQHRYTRDQPNNLNNTNTGNNQYTGETTPTARNNSPNNSKSGTPERETKQTVAEAENFELDNSAFPALPGAQANQIPSVEDKSIINNKTIIQPTAISQPIINPSDNTADVPAKEPSTRSDNAKLNEPAKLSDIVKGTVKSLTDSDLPVKPPNHSKESSKSGQSAKKPAVSSQTSSGRQPVPTNQKQTPTVQPKRVSQTESTNPGQTVPNIKGTVPSKLTNVPNSKTETSQPSNQSPTSPTENKLSYAQMARPQAKAAAAAGKAAGPASPTEPAAQMDSQGDTNNNTGEKTSKDQNGFIQVEKKHDNRSKAKRDNVQASSIAERTRGAHDNTNTSNSLSAS